MQKLSIEKENNVSEVDKYKKNLKRVEKEKQEFVEKFKDNCKLLEDVHLENEKQSRQIKRYSQENEELLQKVDDLDKIFQDEKIANVKLVEKITEKDRQIEEHERRLHDEQKVISELKAKIIVFEAQDHSKVDELLKKVDALENETIANRKEINEKDRQIQEQFNLDGKIYNFDVHPQIPVRAVSKVCQHFLPMHRTSPADPGDFAHR